MTLTELLNRGGRVQQQEQSQEPLGTIRNAVSYPRPGISALRNGQPVTLIATGDIAGMSPAEKYVDELGRFEWAPSDEFTVVDEQVLPIGQEQRQRLLNLTNSTAKAHR